MNHKEFGNRADSDSNLDKLIRKWNKLPLPKGDTCPRCGSEFLCRKIPRAGEGWAYCEPCDETFTFYIKPQGK